MIAMIDWLTLRLPTGRLPHSALDTLRDQQSVLSKTTAAGELQWRTTTREPLRADWYRLEWHLNEHRLQLSGSPARLQHPNNVFGESDPQRCALAMIDFFARHMAISLPAGVALWGCTRLDVTLNFQLGNEVEVSHALRSMRDVSGGRLRVSLRNGTVYWNAGSKLRSGKAYGKGPHLAYQIRKGLAWAQPEQVVLCNRMLRLELSLRSQFWRERAARPWHKWTARGLEEEHKLYFAPMIGALQVVDTNDLLQRLQQLSSKGAAAAAYNTWLAIRAEGLDRVRARTSSATFHRHKQLLFEAGLTWAELQSSILVPLRSRSIEIGHPVCSWRELREAA
jgi:II/X family phage/plasmid replication protein